MSKLVVSKHLDDQHAARIRSQLCVEDALALLQLRWVRLWPSTRIQQEDVDCSVNSYSIGNMVGQILESFSRLQLSLRQPFLSLHHRSVSSLQ